MSTLSGVKIFRLKDKIDSTLSLRKVELPGEIGHMGANIVRWSPDGKWLLLVTSDSRVQIVRDANVEGNRSAPCFLSHTVNLKRLPRTTSPPNYLHGSLGAYDRSICRVAFSADSRILVAGDLSGYLDTWVLEGHEDLTQDPPVTNPDDDDTSLSSSSDESEPENHPILVYAQHWKHSPTAHLIPKLPSGPLLLSFRPAVPSSQVSLLSNGNTHLHPTRHNPHPHSHDLPNGEDRLFVLTAEHQIYELSILAGKISEWSRRNPKSALPKEFKTVRERGMGCIWDLGPPSSTSPERQRIWLYGSTWLWMFDLGQDLPRPAPDEESDSDHPPNQEVSAMRKRKREKAARKKGLLDSMGQDSDSGSANPGRRERDSGAGNRVPAHELDTGVGRKMRKMTGSEGRDVRFVNLDHPVSAESGEEEVEEGNENEEEDGLVDLRRDRDVAPVNGDVADNQGGRGREKKLPPSYWGTFKYRPILGIVPIGIGDGGDEDGLAQADGEKVEGKKGVEVALVERPMFDIDLPGRFYGEQEWSERKDAEVRF